MNFIGLAFQQMLNSKNYKIQFFSLFHWCVFWFCLQNLQNFEDVPIKCSKQFLHYIELICRRSCEKKFKPEFHFFSSFSGFQNPCFFRKFTAEQIVKSFSGKNNSLKLPVFRFSNSLLYGLEESKEWASLSWILG